MGTGPPSLPTMSSSSPEVAQTNCDKISNTFGLMNHDCEPTTKIRGERAEGKYRAAVVTIRDVRDGDELTFNYGKGYGDAHQKLCETLV